MNWIVPSKDETKRSKQLVVKHSTSDQVVKSQKRSRRPEDTDLVLTSNDRELVTASKKPRTEDLQLAPSPSSSLPPIGVLLVPIKGLYTVTKTVVRWGAINIYESRALSRQREGKFEEAAQEYTYCLGYVKAEDCPRRGRLLLQRAEVLREARRWREALSDAETALQLNPEMLECYNSRGKTFAHMGDLTAAETQFHKACDVAEKGGKSIYNDNIINTASREIAAVSKVRLYVDEAEKHSKEGHWGYAEEAINKALAISPSFLAALSTKLTILYKLKKYQALVSFVEDDYAKALQMQSPNSHIEKLTTAEVALLLRSASEQHKFVRSLRFSGQEDKALQAITLLKARNPTQKVLNDELPIIHKVKLYQAAGDANFKEKDYESAVLCYSQALAVDRTWDMKCAALFCARAGAFLAMNRPSEAKRDCDSALKCNASLNGKCDALFLNAYLIRARALVAMGEAEKALLDFDVYLEKGGDPRVREERDELEEAIRQKAGFRKGGAKSGGRAGTLVVKVPPAPSNSPPPLSETDVEKLIGTHYGILGVRKDASKEAIKKAYRTLARVYHPDKNEGSEELMSSINNAYEVLMGDLSRKQYDRTLK